MANITVQEIDTQVRNWAADLKKFALVEYNQDRFFKTAILAISESEQLIKCMETPAGRQSLHHAMKRAASTGLSLNPQEGKAAIIAFGGKASYQVMKDGAIELLMQTGEVKSVLVDVVRENDVFDIERTHEGDAYSYKPARKNRGEIDGYFCAIQLKDNSTRAKYMTVDEVNEVRDNHSAMFKNSPNNSPWTKSPIGMGKKTVIKVAIRDLNISAESKALISAEDVEEPTPEEPKDLNPRPKSQNQETTIEKLKTKKPAPAPEVQEKKEKDGRF